MNSFYELNSVELEDVNGGALEVMIFGKVLTGAAAGGAIGVGVVALAGVAYLAYYVATHQ